MFKLVATRLSPISVELVFISGAKCRFLGVGRHFFHIGNNCTDECPRADADEAQSDMKNGISHRQCTLHDRNAFTEFHRFVRCLVKFGIGHNIKYASHIFSLDFDDEVFEGCPFGTTGHFVADYGHRVGKGPLLPRISVRVAENGNLLSLLVRV